MGQNSPQHSLKNGLSVKRRGFLRWGTLFLSLLSFLGFSKMVQAFLSAGQEAPAPTRYRVGSFEEFPPGTVIKKKDVYLVHDEKGLYALKGDCPHLGCGFRWIDEEGYFECPCHGSRFERSGRFLSGPARKSLQHVLLTKNPKDEIITDTLEPVAEEFRLTEG
jgi:cytochrome b6-f complex iron-sulfur subunit